MQRTFHPVADIFPKLEGAAFTELVEDMRLHGQREPITLHPDGRIVDGRNRYLACLALQEPPAFRTWNEDRDGDLVAYVISLNLRRRHLDESQRAMVGAKLANMGPGGDKVSEHYRNCGSALVAQPDASAMLNVSVDSIQRARKVLNKGTPELVAAVEKGDVSIRAASVIATTDADHQREFVAKPLDERHDVVNAVLAERKGAKVDKSQSAVRERRERLRAMAADGYSVAQIADALGVTEATVPVMAKAEGVVITAAKVTGGSHRLDPNRILEHIVADAENLTADVGLIDLSKVPREQLGDWIDSLERSRRKLSEFISTLKKEHQKHGEAA
jgi:transposase